MRPFGQGVGRARCRRRRRRESALQSCLAAGLEASRRSRASDARQRHAAGQQIGQFTGESFDAALAETLPACRGGGGLAFFAAAARLPGLIDLTGMQALAGHLRDGGGAAMSLVSVPLVRSAVLAQGCVCKNRHGFQSPSESRCRDRRARTPAHSVLRARSIASSLVMRDHFLGGGSSLRRPAASRLRAGCSFPARSRPCGSRASWRAPGSVREFRR